MRAARALYPELGSMDMAHAGAPAGAGRIIAFAASAARPANSFVRRVPLVRIDRRPAQQANWFARIVPAAPARQIAPAVLPVEAQTMAPSGPKRDRVPAALARAPPSAWVLVSAWASPPAPPSWPQHRRRYLPPPPARAAVDSPSPDRAARQSPLPVRLGERPAHARPTVFSWCRIRPWKRFRSGRTDRPRYTHPRQR